ncbi:hypothetical protein BS78_K223500 [Paspalum vaginatum]|uniref:Uncharacterized protein n=1 Tax=Paspalum vaginatum TaxID=158149 RepID=A0A9W8CGQ4_9POAL|nr:hypothetical protein BS78_K223500 [Paspalum vaginatum]
MPNCQGTTQAIRMAGFIQVHKLQLLLLLMIMPCSELLSSKCSDDESVQDPLMMFKFSDDIGYYMVIPLGNGTTRQQEPSLFISPKIPPKEPLETSAPTWTTITQSVIVLAMCKYILFAM